MPNWPAGSLVAKCLSNKHLVKTAARRQEPGFRGLAAYHPPCGFFPTELGNGCGAMKPEKSTVLSPSLRRSKLTLSNP